MPDDESSSYDTSQPAETLVTLVPTDAAIEAEVEIGPQDIAYIRTDDFARMKLDAPPFQRHGTLTGSVRVISDDALPTDAGGPPENRVYFTRLTLD
jgi:membrane fusion protein, hemolysin D